MEDRNAQKLRKNMEAVGISEAVFDELEDADQARVRQILMSPLNFAFFLQLKDVKGFSLPLFLKQPEEVQNSLMKCSVMVGGLCRDVMPLPELLALPQEVAHEFIEYAGNVRKLLHDYRVPLKELLALDAEQRSELIVNANYFSQILSAPENERSVQQLLSIADMNLTEAGVMRQLTTAIEELRGDTRSLFHGLEGGLPPEIILQMVVGLRNPTLIGPQHAKNIVENTELNPSPRGGKK